jgi:hypothetical protein
MRTDHPQKEIIDVLIESSEDFQGFYTQYQATIEQLKIHWFESPAYANGLCTPLRDDTFEIELRTIPPPSEMAFVVAHELYHALLWHNRYPKLVPRLGTKDYRCKSMMGALNSMVYDHYINTKLKEFFNDGCQQLKSSAQHFFDNHLRDKNSIKDDSEIRTVFTYVTFRLNFEILCDASDFRQSEFSKWFDTYGHDLIAKSDVIISLIKTTNMEDPEKVRHLFNDIIKRYPPLKPIVVV